MSEEWFSGFSGDIREELCCSFSRVKFVKNESTKLNKLNPIRNGLTGTCGWTNSRTTVQKQLFLLRFPNVNNYPPTCSGINPWYSPSGGAEISGSNGSNATACAEDAQRRGGAAQEAPGLSDQGAGTSDLASGPWIDPVLCKL